MKLADKNNFLHHLQSGHLSSKEQVVVWIW